MIVYTGRKALHIFDIDRERWIFSSALPDHQYEHIINTHEKDQNDESDSETYGLLEASDSDQSMNMTSEEDSTDSPVEYKEQ